jgi:glycosyltransferase involved in cell wall biosynthesis/ubiquinone/menaquinone biosynthesis C-methylase UbiE
VSGSGVSQTVENRPRTALILVRNTVRHDARVLREAAAIRGLGATLLICGVTSSADRKKELELQGVRVVRLDPVAELRRVRAIATRIRGRRVGVPGPSANSVGQPPSGDERRARGEDAVPFGLHRLKRLGLTAAYYRQGVSLVRTVSPTLVHANDYNTMWIGIAAKLLRGSGLVYDAHELWPDRNGRPEWRPWLLACEALFVRVADVTITTSPGYAAAIAARYRVPVPVLIRNIPAEVAPADGGRTPPPEGEAGALEPTAVYVGGLMPGRGLEQAIDAVALVDGLRLRLIGPGREPYVEELRRRIVTRDLGERAELCPPVAPSDVVAAIRGSSFGLMLIQPTCRSYELTLPNKLFEYAAAGLPMLASDLAVIGPLVRSEGLGEVVPAADVDQIAEAVRRLTDETVNGERRERVRQFAARETWDSERAKLERVYRRAAGWALQAQPPEHDPLEYEQRRASQVYSRYAASSRKQHDWSADNSGNAAIRDELVDAAFELAGNALAPGSSILDVGCGTGWWLERLAAPDGRRGVAGADARILTGLELLPDRVAAARRRVPAAEVQLGDARVLPFEAGSFDAVTLFTVLSSLATVNDAERALSEARRVLRPGGALLIWEPRIRNLLNPDVRLISRRMLLRALAGDQIRTRPTTVLPVLSRHLGRHAPGLYPRLASVTPLLTHRLVCARKE